MARVKARWARSEHSRRPWVPSPGEHLVIDWGEEGRLKIFCAVLAWSRYRFVRFATDMKRETTLALLAECIEELGAVPAVVLSDRMGCLRAQTVANVVVPHPDYVRFATHFSFRPDFCEAGDPQSKGIVESLVGYAKSDLVVPAEGWDDIDLANTDAKLWCQEVNVRMHHEIFAIPAQRLLEEHRVMRALPSLRPPLRRGEIRKVDRLSTVRFGSARYSVPSELIGERVEVTAGASEVVIYRGDGELCRHPLVAPGEVSISDDHYGKPAARARRAIRPRSNVERAFVSLGETAEDFLRAAAAAGTQRLATELADIVTLEASWGRAALVAALERATTFRRFKAHDVRSILAWERLPPWCRRAMCSRSLRLKSHPVHSVTMPWNGCRERAGEGIVTRSHGGTQAPQAEDVPPARARDSAHRQDAALGARGGPAYPRRSRDSGARRFQPPQPPQGGRFPGRQGLR